MLGGRKEERERERAGLSFFPNQLGLRISLYKLGVTLIRKSRTCSFNNFWKLDFLIDRKLREYRKLFLSGWLGNIPNELDE